MTNHHATTAPDPHVAHRDLASPGAPGYSAEGLGFFVWCETRSELQGWRRELDLDGLRPRPEPSAAKAAGD